MNWDWLPPPTCLASLTNEEWLVADDQSLVGTPESGFKTCDVYCVKATKKNTSEKFYNKQIPLSSDMMWLDQLCNQQKCSHSVCEPEIFECVRSIWEYFERLNFVIFGNVQQRESSFHRQIKAHASSIQTHPVILFPKNTSFIFLTIFVKAYLDIFDIFGYIWQIF